MDLGNTLQSFAVLQRNRENVSAHAFIGIANCSGEVLLTVRKNDRIISGFDKVVVGSAARNRVRGVIKGIPTGGPYTLTLQIAGSKEKAIFNNVLVGDLWLLAGQSNMADYGVLPSLAESNPMVHAYYMTNQWNIACDPLHDTGRAVAPVHGGDPACHPKTVGGRGAGPGLPFALAMYEYTKIPQGVIACAHGGTSLAQWEPALKKLGGKSLYGAMYERLRDLGGKVAGLVWYQGCNDTQTQEQVENYSTATRKVFNAVRRDCGNPDLPVVFVQLGPFIYSSGDVKMFSNRWMHIRNDQYLLAHKLKNAVCVPAIDLELCDQIHLSNRGVNTLGKRLADAMQSLREPENHPPQIKVKRLRCLHDFSTANAKIEVTFDNVCGELTARGGIPCGFCLVDKEGNYISDAINCQLEGNKVIVILRVPAVFFNENFQLAYGGSFQPHANVVDSRGRSLPCFMLGARKKPSNMTAYVTAALVSGPNYGSEALEDLNLPDCAEWEKMKFFPAAAGQIYMLCPTAEANTDPKAERKYFFRYQIDVPEDMELKVLFGSDAPFALYCDKKELRREFTSNPVVLDEFTNKLKLTAGRHEFAVVFASNGNRGWGICCRFVRLDGREAPKLLPCCDFK